MPSFAARKSARVSLFRYNEARAAASQKRRRDKENDGERDAWKVEERVT